MPLFEEESWVSSEKADQLNSDLFSRNPSSKVKKKKKAKSGDYEKEEPNKKGSSEEQLQDNKPKEKINMKRKRSKEDSKPQLKKKRKLSRDDVTISNKNITDNVSTKEKVKKRAPLPAKGDIPESLSHKLKKRIAYRDWAMKKNQERRAAVWSKKLLAKSSSNGSTPEDRDKKKDNKKGTNKRDKQKSSELRNKYKDYDKKKEQATIQKETNESFHLNEVEDPNQKGQTNDNFDQSSRKSGSPKPLKKKPNKRNKYKHLSGLKKEKVSVTPVEEKDSIGSNDSSSDSEIEDILNDLLKPKSKWTPAELKTKPEKKIKKEQLSGSEQDSLQCSGDAVSTVGKLPFDISKLKSVFESENATQQDSTSGEDIETTSEGQRAKAKEKRATAPLRDRMVNQLHSARFRFLNEQLYKITGSEALKLMSEDQDAFQVYHEGYQAQVSKWPTNPVDKMINFIKTRPSSLVVADFGCGEAKIAHSVPNSVHSFDLVAANKKVIVCDIANVPLGKNSVDIGVFCLSLMGTNVVEFLCEANRVLKKGGVLLIAEVISRFEKLGKFIHKMEKLGFLLQNKDETNRMFVWLEFKKTGAPNMSRLPEIHLAPCLYKKR